MRSSLARFLPQRLMKSVATNGQFRRFAQNSGLVYFGHVGHHDDHEPVYGFTASIHQDDNHYISGNVHGRDVTMVRRTVETGPRNRTQPHTWLIAVTRHTIAHTPRFLLLSHAHPRDVIEAAFLHADRAEHVALDYQLDAQFLIYAHKSHLEDIKEHMTPELLSVLLAHPEYDYEFGSEHIYVYSRTADADNTILSALLQTILSVTNAYEKSPV